MSYALSSPAGVITTVTKGGVYRELDTLELNALVAINCICPS